MYSTNALSAQYQNTVATLSLFIKGKKKIQTERKKKGNHCSYSAAWNCSYYLKLKKKKCLTKTLLPLQTATVFTQHKHTKCTVSKHCSGIARFFFLRGNNISFKRRRIQEGQKKQQRLHRPETEQTLKNISSMQKEKKSSKTGENHLSKHD